jgi:hypothetical protein
MKIKTIVTLLSVTLLQLYNPVYAQKITIPGKLIIENIILFTDRDIYVNGEQIWFNVLCTTDGKFNEQTLSRVVYLELFNENKESVVQNKFILSNGKTSSFIEIPEDIETGMYNLVAYTQYMRNFIGFETNQMSILIINPMKKGDAALLNKKSTNNDPHIPSADTLSKLKLNIPKRIYKPMELVELNIVDSLFPSEVKYLCVSVIKKGALNNCVCLTTQKIITRPGIDDPENIKYRPEIRNLTLSGKLTDKNDGSPIKNAKVYASVMDDFKQLNITHTDTSGEFTITMNSIYDNRSIYLCTDPKFPDTEFTVYDSFTQFIDNFLPACFNIDSGKIELIKEIYLNDQISKIFRQISKQYPVNPDSVITLFNNPEISVMIDDYIKLPTLLEVFEEIVPFVKVKKTGGNFTFEMYDEKDKIMLEEPLVLYDQIPVFNINELLKIKPKYIEKIEVINRQYIIGNYNFNGLIFIQSKNRKVPEYNLPGNSVITKFHALNNPVRKEYPQYGTGTIEDESIPDFRTLLYMNPDVVMKEHQFLTFFTSNHVSEYDVYVRGISNDGKLFYGKTSFEVKK